jgi:hypothetical protein
MSACEGWCMCHVQHVVPLCFFQEIAEAQARPVTRCSMLAAPAYACCHPASYWTLATRTRDHVGWQR